MQDDGTPKMFIGPTFEELIRGYGTLPESLLPGGEMLNHSFFAWYFCRVAHIQLEQIPEQVSLEGDVDTSVKLRETCDNLLTVYGLDQPGDLEKAMKLIPLCRRIAFMRTMKWDDRFQAWVDSGGRSYNEMTREPPT